MDLDPTVTLRVPATSAYVALVRSAVTSTCARLDFTIDRIDDVKLAVDEAAALLLADAEPDSDLDVSFTPDAPHGIKVALTAPTRSGRSPERDSFTWTVLTALVDEVVATVSSDRRLTVALVVHRAEVMRP